MNQHSFLKVSLLPFLGWIGWKRECFPFLFPSKSYHFLLILPSFLPFKQMKKFEKKLLIIF